MWCRVVQCGRFWCSVVEFGRLWCSVVQCGGVWCSVVECGRVDDSTLEGEGGRAGGQSPQLQAQAAALQPCSSTCGPAAWRDGRSGGGDRPQAPGPLLVWAGLPGPPGSVPSAGETRGRGGTAGQGWGAGRRGALHCTVGTNMKVAGRHFGGLDHRS